VHGQNRIVVVPKILVGKPIIQGTRILVEFMMELLAKVRSHQHVLENYSQITKDFDWNLYPKITCKGLS